MRGWLSKAIAWFILCFIYKVDAGKLSKSFISDLKRAVQLLETLFKWNVISPLLFWITTLGRRCQQYINKPFALLLCVTWNCRPLIKEGSCATDRSHAYVSHPTCLQHHLSRRKEVIAKVYIFTRFWKATYIHQLVCTPTICQIIPISTLTPTPISIPIPIYLADAIYSKDYILPHNNSHKQIQG